MSAEPDRSPYDEQLRHIVAGMLSTTDFTPAMKHPEYMLPTADLVIRQIRKMDQQMQASASVPMDRERLQAEYDQNGPFT